MMNIMRFITSWQFLLLVAYPIVFMMLWVAIRDLYRAVKSGSDDHQSRGTIYDWEEEYDETC